MATIHQPQITLPETNMTPENRRLEDEYPFGMTQFQNENVSFKECKTILERTSIKL